MQYTRKRIMSAGAMKAEDRRNVSKPCPFSPPARLMLTPSLHLSSLLYCACLLSQEHMASAFHTAFFHGTTSPLRCGVLPCSPITNTVHARPVASRSRVHSLSRAPVTCKVANDQDLLTLQDVEQAAAASGFSFTVTQLGPLYRVMIRKTPKDGEEGGKGQAIGYTAGTIVGSLMRQDTMRLSTVNTGNPNSMTDRKKVSVNERGWRSNSVYGLSLLLGAYAGRYAYEQGCRRAELLAIKDNESQHKILERHYRRLGFRAVKDVTDDITCVGGEWEPSSSGGMLTVRGQTA